MGDGNGKQSSITLDVPHFLHRPQERMQAITWCEQHWSDLMFALRERGLGDQIALTSEDLTEKMQRGETDPCWEACNLINIGALQIFGPLKILEEYNGCPVCTFANISQHAADLMAMKFLELQ